MERKLIKLKEENYIIVDDSKIKESDWTNKGKLKYFTKDGAVFYNFPWEEYSETYWSLSKVKKIIHSTEPLENVSIISLSEVEEAINGYSVEKIAIKRWGKDLATKGHRIGFIDGFKALQELTKDKLFTVEDMIKFAIDCYNDNYGTDMSFDERVKINIQHLLSPTEWKVTFNEQGKIKLSE